MTSAQDREFYSDVSERRCGGVDVAGDSSGRFVGQVLLGEWTCSLTVFPCVVSSDMRRGVSDGDHQLRRVRLVDQEHLLLHPVRLLAAYIASACCYRR